MKSLVTCEDEKLSSTRVGTKTPLNVPSSVLEHAAGNENGPKCSLSRAAGRRLRTLFLETVLNRRSVETAKSILKSCDI